MWRYSYIWERCGRGVIWSNFLLRHPASNKISGAALYGHRSISGSDMRLLFGFSEAYYIWNEAEVIPATKKKVESMKAAAK